MIDYLEGAAENCIFRGELVEYARRIRERYPKSIYDHRPYLPKLDPARAEWMMTEQFRVGYACFKREVAKVLAPKNIVEIGVGLGVSALAFMDGCPTAHYSGIDNNLESGKDFPVIPTEFVSERLRIAGYTDYNIIVEDSKNIKFLPKVDLVHVDGDHDYATAINDVLLAWTSNSPWILVDDCRDSTVASAVMWVMQQYHAGSTDWAYFEDTWTGSILICREKSRP